MRSHPRARRYAKRCCGGSQSTPHATCPASAYRQWAHQETIRTLRTCRHTRAVGLEWGCRECTYRKQATLACYADCVRAMAPADAVLLGSLIHEVHGSSAAVPTLTVEQYRGRLQSFFGAVRKVRLRPRGVI